MDGIPLHSCQLQLLHPHPRDRQPLFYIIHTCIVHAAFIIMCRANIKQWTSKEKKKVVEMEDN